MGRSRRISTQFRIGALLAGLFVLACSKPLPNVLFILIDTLRADVLADNAPFVNELGRNGVVFDRVVAPSSWTKTSMASILTSQNPLRHGVRTPEDALPGRLVTLAEGLSAAGYQALGVNTNPWLTERFRFHVGFDRYESVSFADATQVNEAALQLVQENSDRPTFLYLHYMDVHAPYRPSSKFFRESPVWLAGHGVLSDADLELGYREGELRSREVVARARALYEAEVRGVDEALAELFHDLQAQGFLDDALIILTSDHGEAFLEHGTAVHGLNYYPEVYRVPLIMKWSEHIPMGARVESMVSSIDIVPTIFELLALDLPSTFEGRSLLPLGVESTQDRIALGAVGLSDRLPDRDYVGVVSRDFLYLVERLGGDVEFYNLRLDPDARYDQGPDHPEAARHAAFIDASAHAVAASRVPNADAPDKVEIDADTRQQLRALGYLPGDDGSP